MGVTQMKQGPPTIDLMEHVRMRGGGGGAAAAASESIDMSALSSILEEVNDGKVIIE